MKLSVLGSTGSIGRSTLSVVEHINSLTPDRFEIDVLIAGQNVDLLAAQAIAMKARHAVIEDESRLEPLRNALSGHDISCGAGQAAVLEAAARPVDKTMAAISGTAGLLPTLAAIDAGNTILLANKETMVCAGPMVLQRARDKGIRIVPVDSEHNAIFQVLEDRNTPEKITLTASGGPFRNASLEELSKATPEMALAHPNWDMGAKNSLDSATMMNKGLELIEACYLFGFPESQIDVLVHPQSIIHSMVSYVDGSVLAQLGVPDMRTPIAHALAWPERIETAVDRLDLGVLSRLDFDRPDDERFPAISLARLASREGALGTCVYNAANEAAGEAFLKGKCGFLSIAENVRFALDKALDRGCNEVPRSVDSIDAVLHVTERVSAWINQNLKYQ